MNDKIQNKETFITLTPTAAKQVAQSATAGEMQGLRLRISVVRDADGQFQYAMGFDDNTHPGDEQFESEGVAMVVSAVSMPLLKDTTIDYVEIEQGEHRFIFLNPNDPAYVPPSEA